METARPEQLTPSDNGWLTWLIMAGRGFGKTRCGTEDVGWYGLLNPGSRIALVAATTADGRDTVVEGESGLMRVLPQGSVEAWNRSLGEVRLYNGSQYKLFSAEEPDRLRGPQHHRAYCDELASWKYEETWDMLMFGLRLGQRPQTVVATTPKPTKLIKSILKDPRTVITRGSTFDNARNLAPSFLESLREKYEGTRLGRQELYAELLEDNPNALWTRQVIEDCRRDIFGNLIKRVPDFVRCVVAVDPSGAERSGSPGDAIGIVVAGLASDAHAYVVGDLSLKDGPSKWGARVVEAYHNYKADAVVLEKNYGGAMGKHVIQGADSTVPVIMVSATRGKYLRAEPIAALYEQRRVHHIGVFNKLEDEMCEFSPDLDQASPNRLDALVWALTELMVNKQQFKWHVGR